MTRVALVGAGVVGASWSLVFARAGFDVAIYDSDPASVERAVEFVRAALAGHDGSGAADKVVGQIRPATSLEAALDGADYIQESAPERLALKIALYQTLDAVAAPDAILASSTSGLPASAFTEGLKGRARCLVVHPINPPHLIPLVEIVPAPWTEARFADRAEALMRELGQSPIRLRREINGFVVNRLQSALLGEAFRLVEDGVVDADGVDRAVSDGLGLRWCFMGPFQTIDLNARTGIAEYCRNLGPMYHGLAQEQADPRPWSAELVESIERQLRERTPAAEIGSRQRWRDGVLAKLGSFKRGL